MKEWGSTTSIVHADRLSGVEYGAIRKPIHTSIQYGYERMEDLIGVFQGSTKGAFNYARQGTPTTAALESKITKLEQGLGTVCFATGMAALAGTFLSLLKSGDHVVSSKFLFGNTNSLFGTVEDLGISVSKVNAGSVSAIETALRPNTRMVFLETIGNPGTHIPDLEPIGELCRARSVLFVVDNTVTSPALFKPRNIGAGLVINSLSKSIAGHGSALGGAVTDTGLFNWENFPNIFAPYRCGDPATWGLLQLRKKALRDMGASLSSEQANQIAIGAETLSLRIRQSSRTAMALASFLESHSAVRAVHYPGLASHPQHQIAQRLFAAPSWLLSFEFKNVGKILETLNRLRIPVMATGLGDTRTLVIPVAPTIYWEAGPEVRKDMEVADGLVRVSVGLEEEEDLLDDFAQALSA